MRRGPERLIDMRQHSLPPDGRGLSKSPALSESRSDYASRARTVSRHRARIEARRRARRVWQVVSETVFFSLHCQCRPPRRDSRASKAPHRLSPVQDRLLLHQVHPGKLSADIGAAILSSILLWNQLAVLGLGGTLWATVAWIVCRSLVGERGRTSQNRSRTICAEAYAAPDATRSCNRRHSHDRRRLEASSWLAAPGCSNCPRRLVWRPAAPSRPASYCSHA
jgi:hypothetical protein